LGVLITSVFNKVNNPMTPKSREEIKNKNKLDIFNRFPEEMGL
jgi:hypothetical protein